MALTESNMLGLGTEAPEFNLVDTISNQQVSYNDIKGEKGTLVMFICNHCPYVIHVFRELVDLAAEYKEKGFGVVAISSNDIENYPEDAPDKMNLVAKVLKFSFPYLFDESQEVAKAYDAACTPDFYVFDNEDRLKYRGRMDESRPQSNTPVTGRDLRSALDSVLAGDQIDQKQYPSMGCGIKWK